MKKVNIQFHATHDDLYEFIMEMKKKQYTVFGVILFPQFNILSISENIETSEMMVLDMIVVSKKAISKTDNYRDFMKNQDNNLVITAGKEVDYKLYESSMGVWSELEIDSDYKKIINSFKKKMNRGACVLNPYSNIKKYYKNHLYTCNAKKAYEKGVKICPVAGWNEYELTNE